MNNPSKRRIVGAVFLSWLAVLGLDFPLHGGILARLYQEPSPFLLSPEQSFKLIPLGYLSFLLVSVLIVWLLLQVVADRTELYRLIRENLLVIIPALLLLGWIGVSLAGIDQGFYKISEQRLGCR